jgi:predicted RNA-binding protein with PIN domain
MSPVPDYSEDVVASLVRSVGAFIRVAQTQKLTPSLRRLRSFRPQTLARHRDALLRALEDEDLRASLLEWLDDGQVPLNKVDVATLRIAAERPEGWEEKLAPVAGGEAPGELAGKPAGEAAESRDLRRLEARLAREQDKVRAARTEARGTKEAARRREEADARTIEELHARLREVSTRLDAARAESTEAVGAAERRVAAADRAARKATRAAEKAAAQADNDRKRFREANKELGKAQRVVAGLEAEIDRLRTETRRLAQLLEARPATEPQRPTRSRLPLAVPKGRMAEDPQTLAEWLAAPGVRLFVDGYNVTKAEGGYGELPLERQRERLIDEVRTLVARGGVHTVIVFDGSEVMPGAARLMHGGVMVEYSKPTESADDHIIALLEAGDESAILVTNDRDLQQRAAALGATIATSNQLLALIR